MPRDARSRPHLRISGIDLGTNSVTHGSDRHILKTHRPKRVGMSIDGQ